jgi:malate dehydrogenase (oxaloacetate-decarboxylating)(NADP+)
MKEKNERKALRKAALEYHSRQRKGKIEVNATKPCLTQHDLSLAYTPGVAEPCLEIQRNPKNARLYTAKGNLVAVISNGTAVLGLGNIGALAGKPVMEGKGILFKRFADIDVFDIEVDTEDPNEFVQAVKLIAPTFGGINLEDIKAPECFYIEETLKKELDIPVFHDDQHGTAIISGAALLNALELSSKDIDKIKIVFSGAGAAGIACANFYISLGADIENLLMLDSKGVLWKGRGDELKNPYKTKFFRDTEARDLKDAMKNADVFCGLSQKGILSKEMVKTMAEKPIIFAMANPDPEITYPDAKEARPDAIVATGRSDYPNQVNATGINEEMKLATAFALAKLAKEEVPDTVRKAYNYDDIIFGPDYIIPKPFDHRVLISAAAAVAEAAMKTGVARHKVDLDEYREELMEHIDPSREVMRKFHILSKKNPRSIVFPEGMHHKIIEAASIIVNQGIAKPILLVKDRKELLETFEDMHLDSTGIDIIEPKNSPEKYNYVEDYYALRQRKGVTWERANLDIRNYFYFASMMVHNNHADSMLAGVSVNYPEVLRPALQIIGPRSGGRIVAGMYLLIHKNQVHCLADCAVNITPNAEDLAEIATMAASELERFRIEPTLAMLSFANFGSVRAKETDKIRDAIAIFNEKRPDLNIDGPIQADIALDMDKLKRHFPFSNLKKRPNLLIFPNLDAGNISLKMLRKFSSAYHTGPILIGMAKPIHLITRNSEVNNIVDMAAIASVDAQNTLLGSKRRSKVLVK